MGKLLPSFRKAVIDEIMDNISSNSTQYYVFASNPVAYTGNTPALTNDDYSNYFINDWNMLFGKRLALVDVAPAIHNHQWVANTVYNRYNNRDETLYSSNTGFYVITEPNSIGGSYNIFKCIDNANGAASTIKPQTIQTSTFETSDGYKWRYITSITNSNYVKFATDDYVPVYVNTAVTTAAQTQSGIEVLMISNGGSGYACHHTGNIVSVINSSLVQIENSASIDNDFYTKNSIYIYNTTSATAQLFGITRYVSNTIGNWVYLDGQANTQNIEPNETHYIISPKVVISTDGDTQPSAYCTVNTTANSIDSIVLLDFGSNIQRANVAIQSNTIFGSGANVYAIVPPPGGHGYDPTSELDVKALVIGFNFTGSQSNTIVTANVLYNKVGLLKNPYYLNVDGTKGNAYFVNTFSQVLKGDLTSASGTFTVEDQVVGNTTGSIGTVIFANSSQVYLVGDKTFTDGEYIVSANGKVSAALSINTLGDIYVKDNKPLYVQNINNINRSGDQTESFKLIIQV